MRGDGQGLQSRADRALVGWGPTYHAMSVIPLTIFFSLLLAGLFIGLFAHEQHRRRFASAERDSLLPLADEIPHAVGRGSHDHAPVCGCRNGSRPPCARCLQRAAVEDPASDPVYF